jgi:tetratricopeptide (TPR) repeat protein
LPGALGDAVCAQCHLAGEARVLKVDRRSEDFRPGLPFEEFWTVFVRAGTGSENKFVGQFEQMEESGCFRGSGNQLRCVSCHNPHELPREEAKAAYYRGRCLACHSERRCGLAESERLAQSKQDDCVACHMPKMGAADVPHAASANHRIPRHGGEGQPGTGAKPSGKQGELILFHGDRMNAKERAEAERDRGVALCRTGVEGMRRALPLLESAVAARPDDVLAWESKGHALAGRKRDEDAFEAFTKALELEPERESAMVEAARAAARLGKRREAIDLWQRAIASDRWRSDYHGELAFVYFGAKDWKAAAECCRKAIKLNGSWLGVRKLLIQCYLNLGKCDLAREELGTVLGFDPPDRAELEGSFAIQSKGCGG